MVRWFGKPETHARTALRRRVVTVNGTTLHSDYDPAIWLVGPDDTSGSDWLDRTREAITSDFALNDSSEAIGRIDSALAELTRTTAAPRVAALHLPKPKEVGPQVTFTVGDEQTLAALLGAEPDLWIAYADIRDDSEPEQPLDVADAHGWLVRLRVIDIDGSSQGLLRARREGHPQLVATAWIPRDSAGSVISDTVDLILNTAPQDA